MEIDQAISPFWDERCQEMSDQTWSSTFRDLVEQPSWMWDEQSRRMLTGSWFTVTKSKLHPRSEKNRVKQFQAIDRFPQPELVEQPTPLKPPAERTLKIKLLPNLEQVRVLTTFFHAAQFTYNECLAEINQGTPREKKDLRLKCVRNDSPLVTFHPWLLNTPYEIRNEALLDLLKAYKTCFALHRNGIQRTPFVMKPKPGGKKADSIVIRGLSYTSPGRFFPSFFPKEEQTILATEPLPNKLHHDTRLHRNNQGDFFLCVLLPRQVRPALQTPTEKIIALDPGSRTFLTGFDYQGFIYEFAKHDHSRIHRLSLHIDKMKSDITLPETKHRKRQHLKRAIQRTHTKICNMVDEVHKKIALWLCSNYTLILLPKLDTRDIAESHSLHSTSVRTLMAWGHGYFWRFLLHKAKEFPGCVVQQSNESYTTRTCDECGTENPNVGSSEIFNCETCGQSASRDIHAARNIYIRNILHFLQE